MNYAAPVNFDSIAAALDFIKSELQSKVDQNNKMVLEDEKSGQKLRLLQEQIDQLNAKAQDLTAHIVKLESKRETVKQELKDYSTKITERLERERTDFEAVRMKRREELEAREKLLEDHSTELDQVELRLSSRDNSLDDRENQLKEAGDALSAARKELLAQQQVFEDSKTTLLQEVALNNAEIQKEIEAATQKALLLDAQQSELDKKKHTIDDKLSDTEKYRDEALNFMALAENKLKAVERAAKTQADRENQLNLRQVSLIELEKSLTKRKIQLDDREATIKSHSGI